MGRIRMYVYIHNETDAVLQLIENNLRHGSYTEGWEPPQRIEAGQTRAFQGEGELILVPTTGTEGDVSYRVGGADRLYIHWNSPLVESQYQNTFHIWAPPGWEVTHSGGQGHEARLDIRLRRTAPRLVRGFHPARNGLPFPNAGWAGGLPVMTAGFLWNRLLDASGDVGDALGILRADENWLPLTHADAGMCGGMVYAVMDHFVHNLDPTQRRQPTTADDPFFRYLRDRLWESFDVGGRGIRFLAYSSPHYPNGDEGVIQTLGLTRGRSWVTYREAWPEIQADIDAGRLSPVGLIQSDDLDIGTNHQVLVYGYKKDGQDVELYVYDPNYPRKEVVHRFNVTATDGEVHVSVSGTGTTYPHRIFAFFRTDGIRADRLPVGAPRSVRVAAARAGLSSVRQAMGHGGSVRRWITV
ncbi:hypothetical protein ABGB17_13645 [Sphaerisporangium sp. B11E5]|uniref:hypothetical protein n=1 Tax=Sphaerisporangium sp. B11E5 TaxID=3153563 RepID=UPI00325D81CB